MLALLLLPILTCGYVVCYFSIPHYYKLHRYEGQQLYLKCAWLGLNCLFWSLIIIATLYTFLPSEILVISIGIFSFTLSLIEKMIPNSTSTHELTWLFLVALSMHLFAYFKISISNWALNRFQRTKGIDPKIKLMSDILSDSPLDSELFHSYINEKSVLIALANRKVYVGQVVSMGEPNETEGMDQEISILPHISGYRDKNNLTVNFTTQYQSVDTQVEIKVTLRQELIESVSRFDFEVYQQFLERKKEFSKREKRIAFKKR